MWAWPLLGENVGGRVRKRHRAARVERRRRRRLLKAIMGGAPRAALMAKWQGKMACEEPVVANMPKVACVMHGNQLMPAEVIDSLAVKLSRDGKINNRGIS